MVITSITIGHNYCDLVSHEQNEFEKKNSIFTIIVCSSIVFGFFQALPTTIIIIRNDKNYNILTFINSRKPQKSR